MSQFARRATAEAFEMLLAQRQQSLPFLDSLGVIDHLGEPLYSTGNPGFPGHDPEERAHIRRFLQDHAQRLSAVHWPSEPGEHRMLYLRRMFDGEGRFTGLAAARLDLFYFTHALERLQLHEGQSVAFLDDQMRLIARRPGLSGRSASQALGMRVESAELEQALRGEEVRSLTLLSPLDGDRRVVSIGRVEELPFSVIVGHSVDQVLGAWREMVLVLSLGVLVMAALGWLILRHYLHLVRTEDDLYRSEQALRTLNGSLQAELKIADLAFNTHLGMLITDADGIILKVNATFERITGYHASEVLGRNPSILSSGHHDADFYRQMWGAIDAQGSWEGEVWNRRKSGQIYPQWVTISAVSDPSGSISHYVATFSDMSLRRAAEQEAHRLAFYDPLTGLPNRRLVLERLGEAISLCQGQGGFGALLLVDLDGFKYVNDSLGHEVGDELLQAMARRVESASREHDLVARIGGDEFLVLAEGLGVTLEEASQQAERLAKRLLISLGEPCWLGERRHLLSGSIGITLLGDDDSKVEECLQQAEMAMYQAKQAGRNTLRFFDPVMQAVVVRRAILEAELRQAERHQQLRLHYQIQVDAQERVTGVEALLRWQHPELGMVPPYEFIPIAEASQLIVSIGRWVLDTACRQLASWAQMKHTAELTMAVNISPLQFQQPDFIDTLESILTATGANPQRLKLELTETLFMAEPDAVCRTMMRIKALGVRFSLDDFGTGFSSLSYLNRLPLDQLKIDQSFVRTLFEDSANAVISASIIDLGRNLGLEVIAEGVESRAHRDWLKAHGCYAYQGYLFSRPLPIEDLMPLLENADATAG
ncbi:bifunctional diguanylate cyclase/phosphodiesterase [Halomonas sp. E14]|uniref:bifunctional diguanylate cyclase/phosphodiesterase n=1 Tax=Halomonas sp. E14 TaxID=3397245 RepID=UPI00403E6348